MHTRVPTLRVLVPVLLYSLGCEPTAFYQFRIIDEATGRALQGVPVETYLEGHHFNNRMFPASGYVKSFTNDAGIAQMELKTADGLFYYLFVEQAGYQAISGDLYPSEGYLVLARHKTSGLPSDDYERIKLPLKADAVCEISMRRITAAK